MARGRALEVSGSSRSRAGSKGVAATVVEGPMSEPEIYRVSEVARALKVTVPTVHKWIRRGDLLALDLRSKGSTKPTFCITRESFELYLSQAGSW
jgi:excisionase family DNA binding protein